MRKKVEELVDAGELKNFPEEKNTKMKWGDDILFCVDKRTEDGLSIGLSKDREDEMHYVKEKYYKKLNMKDKVLFILSSNDCQIDMSGFDGIMPTATISRITGLSLYKTKKILRELEEEHMAVRVRDGIYDEDNCRPVVFSGWHLAPAARNTEIFRRANWMESKIMWEIWQIVPSQYYITNTAQWHDRLKSKNF